MALPQRLDYYVDTIRRRNTSANGGSYMDTLRHGSKNQCTNVITPASAKRKGAAITRSDQ